MQTAVAETQHYNPVRIRNIPLELAQIARDRGEGLTRDAYKRLGYSDDQLDRHSAEAARLYASLSEDRA